MRILSIKLRGFIGLKRGLGVDEVFLDVSGLSGLVALEGANGMGKTTLLENCQPYRMLPSRTGTLKSHCFLKDSLKELTFEFNGDLYRTLIKIDATTTRSDEGYIYKNGSTASEVDSKVSNYDAYIEKLLGSPTLFFSSIFCAQNSRKLSDLRPAELKALFAEFLRLDRYVAWEETAKGALRICGGAAEGLVKNGETVDTKIRLLGDPRNDLKAAKSLFAQAQQNLESLDLMIAEEGLALEELKKEVAETGLKRQRIKDHERLIEQLAERQAEADTEHQKASITRIMALEDLETELEKKAVILNHAEKIKEAAANKVRFEKELSILNNDRMNVVTVQQQLAEERNLIGKEVHDLNNRLHKTINEPHLLKLTEAVRVASHTVDTARVALAEIEKDRDIVHGLARIEALEKSAGVLDDIDPACTSEVCGLITASLQARDDLPRARDLVATLRQGLKEKRELALSRAIKEHEDATALLIEHESALHNIAISIKAELKQAEDKIEAIDVNATELAKENNEISTSVNLYKDKLAAVIPIADRLSDLIAADDITKNLTREIGRLNALIASSNDAYTKSKANTLDQIENAEVIIKGTLAVINPEAEQLKTNAEARLIVLNNDRRKEDEERVKLSSKIPVIEKEIDNLSALEAELAAIAKRAEWVNAQKTEWDYLRLACSKDGMRALEIEAVAPVITQNANDLLSMTFGQNHSVRFETQDEDGKEVLSIIVIANDGSETPLQFLSGGEKVWILKSLRLAQTLISQEKSGRHFQTALMDEEDGALSADNAISFIELYRSFQAMAKMDLCFYITHRPEAVAMADNILRFKPGKISII